MKLSQFKRSGVCTGVGFALAMGATQANAAGFALIEQSGSGQGNAFAGGAAIAEDASTIFFNPAGMTRLGRGEVVVAGHIILPKAEFANDGSIDVIGNPLDGGNDDGGVNAFVPNFYWMHSVDAKTKFGLGINAPFGLATEYDDDWVGKYHALESEMTTLNINPAFAYKVSSAISFGVGMNIQYIHTRLTNAVDFGAVCYGTVSPAACSGAGVNPQQSDGKAEVEGDDISYGFNLGFLYEFTPKSRLGLAYRSKITHTLEGDAKFDVDPTFAGIVATFPAPGNTLFSDTGVNASVDLPETFAVSYYHELNNGFAFMADYTRTKWSRFKELKIIFDNFVQPASVVEENWEDSNRFAVGMNYRFSPAWMLRTGLAYDETPIPDKEHRTARIPGNDRTWLSLGGSFSPSSAITLDFAYSHLFVDDTDISNTESAPDGALLNGTYENSVDILSAQLAWKY